MSWLGGLVWLVCRCYLPVGGLMVSAPVSLGEPVGGVVMAEPFGGTINVDIRDPGARTGRRSSLRGHLRVRPNVVCIVLDHMGSSAMSCCGGRSRRRTSTSAASRTGTLEREAALLLMRE